ncbi:MAG: menaquinone biosynthesis protein [Acidobacteriota bacterium]|nr:menaquinone biosynthesis protein [Acidobacteriota bacterium]
MTNLSVSVVQYLNTAPLIWGMLRGGQRGRFQMDFTTPGRCADAVRDGRAGAGIIPSIELQRIDGLEAVSGVSISSPGQVKSVLLISRTSIEGIHRVCLDASSRTSAALVTILLRRFYGLRPEIAEAEPDLKAMLERADAALLIGDPALAFYTDPGRIKEELQVYDLAAEWKKFTGLPFVFALWAGPERAGLAKHAADFRASRDYGLEHIDEIAAEYAPLHGLSAEQVKIYLTQNINYNLEESHREALRRFYDLAYSEGLVPAVQEIRFI